MVSLRKEGTLVGGGSVLWYPMKHLALLSLSLSPAFRLFHTLPPASCYRSSSYYPKLHWHPLDLRAKGHLCTSSGLLCAGQNIYIRQREMDWTYTVHPGVAKYRSNTLIARPIDSDAGKFNNRGLNGREDSIDYSDIHTHARL